MKRVEYPVATRWYSKRGRVSFVRYVTFYSFFDLNVYASSRVLHMSLQVGRWGAVLSTRGGV